MSSAKNDATGSSMKKVIDLVKSLQETSSAKNKDVSAQIMIICAKCRKTLPASDFAKKQQKKSQKGKACMCLGCSAKKGSGKTPVKGGASSSSAPANEVVF